ncbi:hypothetical protein NMG60_11035684 [Bertholletia excelsa]
MENTAGEETAREAGGSGDLHDAETPRVRRRLVQSTLFPHRSQDNATDKDDHGFVAEYPHEEENCNKNQSSKKRNQKARASKKANVDGKEILNRRMDDKDSLVIVHPNTLFKAPEGQDQQKTHQLVGSHEVNDKSCSPVQSAATPKASRQAKQQVNSTPIKRRVQTTPKKDIGNGGFKKACSEQLLDSPIHSESLSRPIPDLRLEAKLTAEENARISAGRQIHPFFSSWKKPKKNQERIDFENNLCSSERKDEYTLFNPIHVFEKIQDEPSFLDWGNWTLSKTSYVSTKCDAQSVCPEVFEGYLKPLHFDDFLNVNPNRTSLPQDEAMPLEEMSLDQSSLQQEIRLAMADMPNLLNHDEKADYLLYGGTGLMRSSDLEWEGRFVQERMIPYYHGSGNHPENSLWTNKYLPEKAIEVCGNRESVDFLSEWLRLWSERGFRSGKESALVKKVIVEDDDYNCCGTDSDSENSSEEIGMKNVVLITGPVGSGKSAAIYACAKEQGFHVIEVNASDWRTGTLVMQRFRDSVKSHLLQSALENHVGSESKPMQKYFSVTSNTSPVQGSGGQVVELMPLSDEEDSQNDIGPLGKFRFKENKIPSGQSECKPLILFEDVDAILSEDQGLIAAIQKLAEIAKWPMILTSNSDNPLLPHNLDRLELHFTKPSTKELLYHVSMVCSAEKAKIHHYLVERFIAECQGDIRKTIMHLQFWCQGQKYREGNKEQGTYGQLLFDIDAGHRILPKIIPWGYPSQLSEFVEKEINKSLIFMEESLKLAEPFNEEEPSQKQTLNRLKRHNTERDSIEAKKEAILSRHCPVQDGNEFVSPLDAACEFSVSSGSPVAFTRRNVRRKLDAVLSSSSGSESLGNSSPAARAKLFEDTNDQMFHEVDGSCPSLATETCLNLLSENFANSGGENFWENCPNHSEPAIHSQIDGTCKSVNISCWPEISFVPETEINDGASSYPRTVFFGHVADTVEAVSIFKEPTQSINPVESDHFNKPISDLPQNPELIENTFDIHKETAQGEEEGDSHTEPVEAVPRGYQVMDECSRIDFARGTKSKDELRSSVLVDSVQETWRQFHGCHTDLRQYMTSGEIDASLALKLACGMANLISEADILLNGCQLLTCDYLEPPAVPFEESYSFGWYYDQLFMASSIAQHGICFYAKKLAVIGLKTGSENTMELARAMLASSTNTMVLGKLVSEDRRTINGLESGPLQSVIPSKSELGSCLCSVVQSILPSRSYLATKGDALYEYVSALGQISRSEISRLSLNTDKTSQRRVRATRNYLSTGSLMLPDEDISLLGQCHQYGKVSSQSLSMQT